MPNHNKLADIFPSFSKLKIIFLQRIKHFVDFDLLLNRKSRCIRNFKPWANCRHLKHLHHLVDFHPLTYIDPKQTFSSKPIFEALERSSPSVLACQLTFLCLRNQLELRMCMVNKGNEQFFAAQLKLFMSSSSQYNLNLKFQCLLDAS